MAVPRQTGPVGLRVVAVALAMGGLIIGIGLPLLLIVLGIRSTEILPGIDAMLLICPVIGIVDLIMAGFFWRRANAADRRRDGPVVN